MDLGLKGLRALVTGGTKGIGRRCADIFADEGANVSVCARDAAGVEATVAALKGKGVTAFGQALDVADKARARGLGGGQRRGARRHRHRRSATSRRWRSATTRSPGRRSSPPT